MTRRTRRPWAHAHLADLTGGRTGEDRRGSGAAGLKAALHSVLPATSDGRGAMFIEYKGFPFADPAFDARIVPGGRSRRDKRKPFYRNSRTSRPGSKSKAEIWSGSPPRLWTTFKTFSFITSNAGTLPLALQRKDPVSSWMPDPDIIAPNATPPLISTAVYQRRTAIAQMAIDEQVKGARPRRIGAPIEGVAPRRGLFANCVQGRGRCARRA